MGNNDSGGRIETRKGSLTPSRTDGWRRQEENGFIAAPSTGSGASTGYGPLAGAPDARKILKCRATDTRTVPLLRRPPMPVRADKHEADRKSTRLNSSH